MVMRARKLNRVNVKERISMFDKRLFSLAPGVGRLVAAKVLCQWIGLLSNVVFVVTMVLMLFTSACHGGIGVRSHVLHG